MECFFVSDLHGHPERYRTLFAAIERRQPASVFLGGDLLPSGAFQFSSQPETSYHFVTDVLGAGFQTLRQSLGRRYPEVFLILGNDDGRGEEAAILDFAVQSLWHYAHNRRIPFGTFHVYGYAYVPPTPFTLKDWERYDVSRYVDPGCTSPEEGMHSLPISADEARWSTIAQDLKRLTATYTLDDAIMLFHAPPYQTKLDRAALDGQMVENVPLDVHVGSIAIHRFIRHRHPRITLHGHVHESARLTGSWHEMIGDTHCFSAAHDGEELALVRFDPQQPDHAVRELL